MRPSPASSRWLLLPAALLLLALCLVANAGAETLREKYDHAQGKLSHVRESQSALVDTIAEQNRAIDSMLGEVSRKRSNRNLGRNRASSTEPRPSWKPKEIAWNGSALACSGRSRCCATAWSLSTRRAAPT